jgi:hypothetical protein
MFSWLRRSISGTSKEKHWGSICAITLAQEPFAELRNHKAIHESLMDQLGNSIALILDGTDVADQASRAREELIIWTRALGSFKRIALLSEDTRRALALEYWPDRQLSDKEILNAAAVNSSFMFAKVMCLSLVLNDLLMPRKESWWSDYLLLIIADPNSHATELAELAIRSGAGLDGLSDHIEKAKDEIRKLGEQRVETES